MGVFLVFLLLLIVALIIMIAANLIVVPQSAVFLIEHLGRYKESWTAGLHFKTPFIERIANKVSLKEQVVDFPPQPVITKDNVTLHIGIVVSFHITDPRLCTYSIEHPMQAVEKLAITTLRNIIGALTLDSTLNSLDAINSQITLSLDEIASKWGIKVHRVVTQNKIPPM